MKLLATSERIGGMLREYWYANGEHIWYISKLGNITLEQHMDDYLYDFKYTVRNTPNLYTVRFW